MSMEKSNPLVDAARSYFLSIPWGNELITAPGTAIFNHLPRGSKENSRDKWSITTLGKDANCILHSLTIYKTPSERLDHPSYREYTPDAAIPEATTLYALGDGTNGWPGYCHGGFLATMIDDSAVALFAVGEGKWDAYNYHTPEVQGLTTGMNIRYKAPARAPGILIAKARYKEKTGRKLTVAVEISDQEGKVVTTGEILWADIRMKL